MPTLVTNQFRKHLIDQIKESVTEQSNTLYYVFVSDQYSLDITLTTPSNSYNSTNIQPYRNMLFGKKISNTDVCAMIRYIPYESKVFDMYDHTDSTLDTKDFYCTVEEGSYFHTYKCLDNNLGNTSTQEPTFSHISGSNTEVYQTSDGYKWKYMYSISNTIKNKFGTEDYIPVIANSDVVSSSKKGALNVIKVMDGGRGYSNYITGTFFSNNISINSNNTLYTISNSIFNSTLGHYNGCLIYLSSGTGAGGYRTISNSFSNANGNFIVIDQEFETKPTNGTEFQIYPKVTITSDGSQTINAVSRALVNSTASNSIYRIEMLNSGKEYNTFFANIEVSNSVSSATQFKHASILPIYEPDNGHGTDPESELASKHICFSLDFANTESNTIVSTGSFKQIGVLKNPLFANVTLEIKNTNGTFTVGETLYKINPIRINTDVLIQTNTNVLTCENFVLSNVSVVSSGTGGSYAPGDILNVSGGISLITSQISVVQTAIRTVSIANAGSSYVNGDVVTLSGGTGTSATFTVTTNATGFANSVSITNFGAYTVNPSLANVATTGGSGSGLRVTVNTGLLIANVYASGSYAKLPTSLSNNVPISNTGTGVGAVVSLTFTGTGLSDFENQLTANQVIYLKSKDGTEHHLATVNTITNATHLTLKSNGFFACSQALMYVPNITTSATLSSVSNSTQIFIKNVNGLLNTDDILIGNTSGTKTQINTISFNAVTKTFNTFSQLYKYEITPVSNYFIENEIVYQGINLASATATASVQSLVSNTFLYTSNQVGQFSNTQQLKGATSGALATILNKYNPELVFDSGEILYLENIEPVERQENQTEKIKIIFSF